MYLLLHKSCSKDRCPIGSWEYVFNQWPSILLLQKNGVDHALLNESSQREHGALLGKAMGNLKEVVRSKF